MPKPEDWLRFAEYDLRTANLIINTEEDLIPTALYHVQQCAEKALKGYLLFKNIPVKKTHDIFGLAQLCADIDPEFISILADAADVNPFSTSTRYPDDFYAFPSLDTTRILIEKANKIYQLVDYKIYSIY